MPHYTIVHRGIPKMPHYIATEWRITCRLHVHVIGILFFCGAAPRRVNQRKASILRVFVVTPITRQCMQHVFCLRQWPVHWSDRRHGSRHILSHLSKWSPVEDCPRRVVQIPNDPINLFFSQKHIIKTWIVGKLNDLSVHRTGFFFSFGATFGIVFWIVFLINIVDLLPSFDRVLDNAMAIYPSLINLCKKTW